MFNRCFNRVAVSALCAAVCITAAAQSAHAVTLAFDDINYAAETSLIGKGTFGGSTGWGFTWENNLANVNTGSLTYPGITSTGNSGAVSGSNRTGRFLDVTTGGNFAAYTDGSFIGRNSNVLAAAPLYISFLSQTQDTTNGYRGHFEMHRGSYNDSNRWFQIANEASNGFGAYVNGQYQSLGAETTASDLYVLRFDFAGAGSRLRIFRNPNLAAAEPAVATASFTGGDYSFDRLAMAAFGGAPNIRLDEIRVANNSPFAAAVVPESGSLALLVPALALVGIGFRRRN